MNSPTGFYWPHRSGRLAVVLICLSVMARFLAASSAQMTDAQKADEVSARNLLKQYSDGTITPDQFDKQSQKFLSSIQSPDDKQGISGLFSRRSGVFVKNDMIEIVKLDSFNPQKNLARKIGAYRYIVPLGYPYGGGFLLIYLVAFDVGEVYNVVLYNDEGREQSRGRMHVWGPIPVAVVQLKTDSPNVPRDLRNQWILGVVCSENPKNDTASVQGKIIPEGLPHQDSDLIITPIRWDKYSSGFTRGTGLFDGDYNSTFEFR